MGFTHLTITFAVHGAHYKVAKTTNKNHLHWKVMKLYWITSKPDNLWMNYQELTVVCNKLTFYK